MTAPLRRFRLRCSAARLLLLAVFAGACLSCSTYPFGSGTHQGTDPALDRSVNPAPETSQPAPETEGAAAPARGTQPPADLQPDVSFGTGRFVKSPPTPGSTPAIGASAGPDARSITLNFQGADIQDVVKVILGDLLQRNYIIDPGVSGTVNSETSRGLSKEDLLPVLETLLEMNGAAMIDEGATLRIVPRARALKGSLAPQTGARQRTGGYGVQIVTLDYLSVTEMQKILEPFLPETSLVYVDERRNLMMLAGNSAERRRFLETIEIFDVDWMKGMSVGLYPLHTVEPKTMIKELESALEGESGKLMNGLVKLTAIERLNALLVVSPSAAAVREIASWVERLDRTSPEAGPRLFVYHVQNAKAIDLATILNEIFGGRESEPRRTLPPVELAPGAEPVELRSSGAAGGAAPGQVPTPPGEGLSLLTGNNIRIIADEVHNALVVLATAQEYEIVEAAIRKLDIMPLQVLIEATILEVTLDNGLEYGVEWFFKNNLGDDKEGRGLLDLGSGGLAPLAPSFSYAVVDSADQIRAVVNALETESEVNVLSAPSLMVLDNQTASINVGDEIPVPTRQSTSNVDPISPTVNEIDYRSTGVTLSVTPRVNAGGLVTMEVDQEVSDAVETTSSELNAPTIQQRHIASVVAVHSGETVILGGLIRDTATRTRSGVPFLHRIPVVGNLFGRTGNSGRRTELLVLITPRAVNNRDDARQITREFRDKMRGFRYDAPASTPSSP